MHILRVHTHTHIHTHTHAHAHAHAHTHTHTHTHTTMTKLTKEIALREIPAQPIIPSISIITSAIVPVIVSADTTFKPISKYDITKTAP